MCLGFGGSEPILEGYIDTDMASDLDERKSTQGPCLLLQRELFHGNPNCRNV